MKPLTQTQLNKMPCACGEPDDIMYFHQRCHTGAGLEAHYNKKKGIITMSCKTCKSLVCEVEVAKGDGGVDFDKLLDSIEVKNPHKEMN